MSTFLNRNIFVIKWVITNKHITTGQNYSKVSFVSHTPAAGCIKLSKSKKKTTPCRFKLNGKNWQSSVIKCSNLRDDRKSSNLTH